MFVVFEHEGLFLRSGTEITQLKRIHSEMEAKAHFPVRARCCMLTAKGRCVDSVWECHDKAAQPATAPEHRHSRLLLQVLWPGAGSTSS